MLISYSRTNFPEDVISRILLRIVELHEIDLFASLPPDFSLNIRAPAPRTAAQILQHKGPKDDSDSSFPSPEYKSLQQKIANFLVHSVASICFLLKFIRYYLFYISYRSVTHRECISIYCFDSVRTQEVYVSLLLFTFTYFLAVSVQRA